MTGQVIVMDRKRQKYTKDRYGVLRIYGVAIFLVVWLTLAGNTTGRLQFYLWVLVVGVLWAEAMYGRDPQKYPVAKKRRIIFVAISLIFMFMVSGLAYIIDNPEVIGDILGSLE
jgi:hypothetical protein